MILFFTSGLCTWRCWQSSQPSRCTAKEKCKHRRHRRYLNMSLHLLYICMLHTKLYFCKYIIRRLLYATVIQFEFISNPPSILTMSGYKSEIDPTCSYWMAKTERKGKTKLAAVMKMLVLYSRYQHHNLAVVISVVSESTESNNNRSDQESL